MTFTYPKACMLCFDEPPCSHWPDVEDVPLPPNAPAIILPEASGDPTYDGPEDVVEGRADPLTGLRSPHTPAPRWASQSRIVKFCRETGFEPWPRQQEILATMADSDARTVVLCLGRRSGKDETATHAAIFEAVANAAAHREAVQEGEEFVVALIGNSADQARDLMRTVKRKLQHPALAPFVTGSTADSVTLSTGARIKAFPTNSRIIRGNAIAVAIVTELAHALDSEGRLLSTAEAGELMSALLPATAQFPAGRVIVSSTPRWASGTFADLLAAGDDPTRPDVIAFQAGTPEINPTIPAEFYRAEAARSWAEYKREYLAQVTADADSAIFDPEAVEACMAQRGDLPRVRGHRYLVSLDPAFRHDDFACIIGHLDGSRLIVDAVRHWRPGRRPLDPVKMADRVASLAGAYGASVTTDQAGADALLALFRERRLSATSYAWDNTRKQRAVDALTERLWRGTIELPRSLELAASLTGVERKRTAGGTVRYEAAKGAAPDDLAHALMALVYELDRTSQQVVHSPESPWD